MFIKSDYSTADAMEEAFGVVPEAETTLAEGDVSQDARMLEFKPDPADMDTHTDQYVGPFRFFGLLTGADERSTGSRSFLLCWICFLTRRPDVSRDYFRFHFVLSWIFCIPKVPFRTQMTSSSSAQLLIPVTRSGLAILPFLLYRFYSH